MAAARVDVGGSGSGFSDGCDLVGSAEVASAASGAGLPAAVGAALVAAAATTSAVPSGAASAGFGLKNRIILFT